MNRKEVVCHKCSGTMYQVSKFEKRYNRESYKCSRCDATTTLSPKGVRERLILIFK